MAAAALKQQQEKDENYKVTQHTELHSQIMQQSQGYYEQKKQMEVQQRQVDEQRKEQEKFQVKQLQKQDRQVATAKAAANNETNRNLGAG